MIPFKAIRLAAKKRKRRKKEKAKSALFLRLLRFFAASLIALGD
jgi:hypothetical protein